MIDQGQIPVRLFNQISDNKIQMRSYSEILQVIFLRVLKDQRRTTDRQSGELLLWSLTESYRKLFSHVHIFCSHLLDAVVMGSLLLYF